MTAFSLNDLPGVAERVGRERKLVFRGGPELVAEPDSIRAADWDVVDTMAGQLHFCARHKGAARARAGQ